MEQFTILPITVIPCSLILGVLMGKTLRTIIPKSYQTFGESIAATILSLMSNLKRSSLYLYPLLLTTFILLFISNYIGLIPYSITASTEFVLTLSLAFIMLGGILIHSLFLHGSYTFGLFLPAGTPIALLPLMIP